MRDGPAVDGVSRRQAATIDNFDLGFHHQKLRMAAPSPRAGMRYSEFVFESYRYDPADASLSLTYRFAEGPRFEERLVFDFPPQPLSAAAEIVLDKIFRLIFLLSGRQRLQGFCTRSLALRSHSRSTRDTAAFLQKFYEKGFGGICLEEPDFAARPLPISSGMRLAAAPPLALDLPRRTCVPIGGGKDLSSPSNA